MTNIPKPKLRQKFLQIRNALTPEQGRKKSERICQHIAALGGFQNAQHILAYYPYQNEVNLLPLIEQYPQKNWYLPRLESKNRFVATPFTSLKEFKKNQYGIPEPLETSDERYENKLDLILIPGLAFDEQGNRLGMGKGYYDRYLEKVQGVFKIGICFNQQRVDQVPTDPYDVPVDLVITDDII